MRQCPDCEEKDRVVIAGKVFCANCGAPWQTADKAEEEKYLQKVGLGTTPPPAAESAGGTTMSTEPEDPVKAALAAAGGSPTPTSAPAPASPTTAPAAPQSAPASPPTVPVAEPAPTPTPVTPPPPVPTPVPAPTSPPPPTTPNAVTVPMGVPVSGPATTLSAAPPASASSAPQSPAPTPAPTLTQTPSPTPVITTESLKEEVGSEIPTLDTKEEPILSDSQFKELASTTPTAPVASPVPRPMNDVVVPASSAASAAVAAPSPSVATAAAMATPATSSATTSNMATVAGVTMSREDALKLALGDEVGADVAKPEDKTEKKGPARPTAVVMSVIALILLGAYLWQVNYPNFALRLAAMRAGVSAAAPGYVPMGWSEAKQVKTGNGSLSYTLTKGDKSLTMTETKSNWDSQAVLEQHVLKNSSDYLALQAQGLTIYVYGDNQAAWVNHGSFFTLTGDHGIDQDDMIRMATSL